MLKNYLTIFCLCVPAIFACNKKPPATLIEIVRLSDYPSASAIEFLNKHLYIIGDDATQLLILDTSLKPRDSIALYPYSTRRLEKATKPDLESMTVVRIEQRNKLLVLGSGSLSPYRNVAWVIDPFRKTADSIRLDSFYARLLKLGLKEINIEGMTSIPGAILLANRGHKNYPVNFLVVASPGFWKSPSSSEITLIRMGINKDSALFQGVSGMCYASKSDRLILSVSTEDTRTSYEDGKIGKSYLWIVKNISSKKEWSGINPDQIIDLEAIDSRIRGQKLESVCVTEETRTHMQLALVADNDDGTSTIFRMVIKK
jgi:hypothetical protein